MVSREDFPAAPCGSFLKTPWAFCKEGGKLGGSSQLVCKWLKNGDRKRPQDLGSFHSKWPNYMAYKGGLLTNCWVGWSSKISKCGVMVGGTFLQIMAEKDAFCINPNLSCINPMVKGGRLYIYILTGPIQWHVYEPSYDCVHICIM